MPLVVGFLLTTVLGGLLGFFFQQRTWAHQHRVQTHDRERERAAEVFEEVSRLLDRRLYRLRLLAWSLLAEGDGRSEQAESSMENYRQVLFEWNDSLNRNLALIQQYFGAVARDRFDRTIGAAFIELGRTVEAMWKQRGEEAGGAGGRQIQDVQLTELGGLIYVFNLDMIKAVQSGRVGLGIDVRGGI